MKAKLSQATPIGPGFWLNTMAPFAPAALALAILSTKASSPRLIKAILPLRLYLQNPLAYRSA